MFLEAVVPDHSLDSKGFTYFVPDHLHASVRRGCVVEVPFGDELTPAVVTETDAPPPDRTEAKAVVSILVPEPVVAPYQIEAAYAISRRYFVFLHTALSFFLPTPVFRRFL
ncbi:MAG: PriA 3primeBD protein [Patescibacteria group bacterium]|nr:PriA 3primeBD protein [Patescibacteria group bacterium]